MSTKPDGLVLVCREHFSATLPDNYTKALPGKRPCALCGKDIQQGPGVLTVQQSALSQPVRGSFDAATDKLQWLVDDTKDLMTERMEKTLMKPHQDPGEFKPGIYKHYKRPGNYIALHLTSHHDSDELYVVYVCGETGRIRIREWASPGCDSWSDMLVANNSVDVVQRFTYMGPAT